MISASVGRVNLGTGHCYYRAGPPLLSLLLAYVGPARLSSLIVRGRRATVNYKPLADLGAGCLYSPRIREGVFSETHIEEAASLSNATGGKPTFWSGSGPMSHAPCYTIG